MNRIILCILISSIIALGGCGFYSMKGISIPAEVKSFYIYPVQVETVNSPIELPQVLYDELRQKIQQETRLVFREVDADIEFEINIQNYFVNAVAPEEGNTTALNRMEIKLKTAYTNTIDEEASWNKSYSDFEDFASDQSLIDVQDQLILAIIEDINDRIFNDAFTNW